jgi:hypothetical protein
MVMTKKDRRHSGRKTVSSKEGDITYWDDWNDIRDGLRNPKDNTKLRNKNTKFLWFYDIFDIRKFNKKIKKLLLRRKIMKNKGEK